MAFTKPATSLFLRTSLALGAAPARAAVLAFNMKHTVSKKKLRHLIDELPSEPLRKLMRTMLNKNMFALLREQMKEEDFLYITEGGVNSSECAGAPATPSPEKAFAYAILGRTLCVVDSDRRNAKKRRLIKERLTFHGGHSFEARHAEWALPESLMKILGSNASKQRERMRLRSLQDWFSRIYAEVIRLRNTLATRLLQILFNGTWNPLCGPLMTGSSSASLEGLRKIRDALIDEAPEKHPLTLVKPGFESARPIRLFREPIYAPNSDTTNASSRYFKGCASYVYWSVSMGAIIDGVLELVANADEYHYVDGKNGKTSFSKRSESNFKQTLSAKLTPYTTSDAFLLHYGLSLTSSMYNRMRRQISNNRDIYSLHTQELKTVSEKLFTEQPPPSGIMYYGKFFDELISQSRSAEQGEIMRAYRMERALRKRAKRLKVSITTAPLTISCQVPLLINFDHDNYERNGVLEVLFKELHNATYDLEVLFTKVATAGEECPKPFHRTLNHLLSYFSVHGWEPDNISVVIAKSITAAHKATATRLIHVAFDSAFDYLEERLDMEIEQALTQEKVVQIGDQDDRYPSGAEITVSAVRKRLEELERGGKLPFQIIQDPLELFRLLFVINNDWLVDLFDKLHSDNIPRWKRMHEELKEQARSYFRNAPQYFKTRRSPPLRIPKEKPLPKKKPEVAMNFTPEEMELCCAEELSWKLPECATRSPPIRPVREVEMTDLPPLDISRRWFINDILAEPVSEDFATALTKGAVEERTQSVFSILTNLLRQIGRIFDSRPEKARQAFLSVDDNVLLSALGGTESMDTIRELLVVVVCNALLCITRDTLSDRAVPHNTYLITLSMSMKELFPEISISEDDLITSHINVVLALQTRWCITTNLMPDERHRCEELFHENLKCNCRYGSCIWSEE